MSNLKIIRGPRKQVFEKTQYEFQKEVDLVEQGILLLVEATNIISEENKSNDPHTADGASKIATFRFLSTLPISITWCLDIAKNGDYLISKNILRLSQEEVIKLAYYSTNPDAALKQIIQDSNRDNVRISEMLEELDIPGRQGLLHLHGNLSNLYSHANLNLPPELVFEENGNISIGGGSRFLPEIFEAIIHQIIIFIGNTIKYLVIRHTKLLENETWVENGDSFINQGATFLKSRSDVEGD